MLFELGTKQTVLCVEPEGYAGVRRIAGKVAGDICKVTGSTPEVAEARPQGCQTILCATLGKSPLADRLLEQGTLNRQGLEHKREVYQICYAQLDGETILVICGSDKRGTIYGMFTLSEYIGVSPLVFWGDALPRRRERVVLGPDLETISREPSVTYRGFFINDEWPCFGSWATSHFGGINADCYDQVFELLLRLKGNFLWPAMWQSSFPLDGPGSANEELADLYGVVMGASHHEPCLRASEEWDKVRGESSVYGNDWNFDRNEAGLLRYWEDALKRSGGYENIITIGMRGERDSAILGREATLADNIDLLKRVITKQRQLISTWVPRKATQMLALYKEVERYFYGDETTEGLKSWQELEDVLFLLCEDNYGHLRTVPPRELADHPGGWGMYYHFDYHGAPISYEWMDSTPLSQTWEQMTQAWEFGIRELWIVNVGDLKFHEVPLGYFLALAYNFDRWGSANPHSPQEYLAQWAAAAFPESPQQKEICQVVQDYIAMNSLRRPEALHAEIYHPCHYRETDRMLEAADNLQMRSGRIYSALCPRERKAYYSMVHFPVLSSVNLLKLFLYAGKNHHYARQGKPAASLFRQQAKVCIRQDRELLAEWSYFQEGKWDGMQQEAHIGFTKWNEDDCRYPLLVEAEPMGGPSLKVSRVDAEPVAVKNYGAPSVIPVHDFLYAGVDRVTLEVANSGSGLLDYTVSFVGEAPQWLTVAPLCGAVSHQAELTLTCSRQLLPVEPQTCTLLIRGGDAAVAVEVRGRAVPTAGENIFLERDGVLCILAEHFWQKTDVPGGRFYKIEDYGKFGSGMKVAPATAAFGPEDAPPRLTYAFVIPEADTYRVQVLAAPNNPTALGTGLHVLLETGGQKKCLELVAPDFRAGDFTDIRWCSSVLDQIHTAETEFFFDAGETHLTIGAQEPGLVLEKIVLRRQGAANLPAYLGPEESAWKGDTL